MDGQPRSEFPPTWRVVLGFLLAPALAAILIASWFSAFDGRMPLPERIVRSAKIYAIVGAYPSAVICGVPAYLILRRHLAPSILNCMAAGAAVAALPLFVISLLSSGLVKDSLGTMLLIGASGAVAGLLFWFVVASRRDRS